MDIWVCSWEVKRPMEKFFFFYFIVNIRINHNSKMESGENLQLEKETKEEQVF